MGFLCGADGTDPSGFCRDYLLVGDDSFEDPDGTPYSFYYAQTFGATASPSTPSTPSDPDEGGSGGGGAYTDNKPTTFDHIIYVSYNAKCNGEIVELSTGIRKVALQYKLEGGGVVCVNN